MPPVRHRRIAVLVAGAALVLSAALTTSVAEAAGAWQGFARSSANVRAAPSTRAAVVAELPAGAPVTVVGWDEGTEVQPDNRTWARLGEGQYVYSARLRHAGRPDAPPPAPTTLPSTGHWADADLARGLMTFYDGATPVRTAVMSSGRPGYESPEGTFRVLRRVASEHMQGPGYDVYGVQATQYITSDGVAIHRTTLTDDAEVGIPRSHGCLGLRHDDAWFAWDFLGDGGIVVVHS